MIKYHHPKKLPIKYDLASFSNELAQASFELGKLDGLQRNLLNPSILISPLLVKEATISSRIEGTRSTVSDVLEYEATGESRFADAVEVSNYKKAMVIASEELKEKPLNLGFTRSVHQILLENTRGHKNRGKFRDESVWIGKEGDPIEKARYVPPENFMVSEYMENLENYMINNDEHPLPKIGIIHYQFEAIHPFNDGNGRVGRLLIPLYLYWKELLFQPTLYISGYFDAYKDAYINHLNEVDRTGDFNSWLKFFFTSIKQQAKETQEIISQINVLKNRTEEVAEKIRSPYIYKIVNYIFTRPIFRTSMAVNEIKLNNRTARRLLSALVDMGVLRILEDKDSKEKLYIFSDLIKILSY
jgi:Fic family protein